MIFLMLILVCSCQNSASKSPKTGSLTGNTIVRLPAQWEAQEAVWLIFPNMDHVQDLKNQDLTQALILALVPHVLVRLVVANDSLDQVARNLIPKDLLSKGQVELFKLENVEFWARDVAPVFIEKDGRLAATDFNFDAWSYADTSEVEIDESLDERIAATLGIPSISTQMIHEGGNLESNGKGTLIVCGKVELQRNPEKSKAEIETILKKMTGASQIIWLNRGVYEDDSTFDSPIPLPGGQKGYTLLTTGGHTDEFVRFVNDSTVLLAEPSPEDLAEDPIARVNKIRMDENLAILRKVRLPDGRSLKVLRIPTPITQFRTLQPNDWVYQAIADVAYPPSRPFPKGKPVNGIAATSYCNFLITNGLIIGQKYWKPGMPEKFRRRDEAAKAVLKAAFPDRKIVMLDALAVNYGGGGIHCITMHQPKVTRSSRAEQN